MKKTIVVKVGLSMDNEFIIDDGFVEKSIGRKLSAVKNLTYSFSDSFVFIQFEEQSKPFPAGAFQSH